MVLLSVMLIISCDDDSKPVYTVTFNSKGGSDVDLVEVKEGDKVTKPTDPEKDNYTFVNWTTDGDGKEVYDFESAVTSDITLYAQWTEKVYKVIFNSNEGSAVADANVKYGDKVAKPDNPTKANYVFYKWTTDKEGKTKYDFESAVNKDITLYAQWISDTFQLGQKSSSSSPITWNVLTVNEANNCALLISQDILEKRQFHNKKDDATDKNYESSKIHDYLISDEFFTTYGLDKSCMMQADISGNITTPTSSGSEYVFLLSRTEATGNSAYFADNTARVAKYENTPTNWWLRSPSSTRMCAYFVDSTGVLYDNTDACTDDNNGLTSTFGVRPAFWYKLN